MHMVSLDLPTIAHDIILAVINPVYSPFHECRETFPEAT
jgi:hypothetical protein